MKVEVTQYRKNRFGYWMGFKQTLYKDSRGRFYSPVRFSGSDIFSLIVGLLFCCIMYVGGILTAHYWSIVWITKK
jgi:hypothetical protein